MVPTLLLVLAACGDNSTLTLDTAPVVGAPPSEAAAVDVALDALHATERFLVGVDDYEVGRVRVDRGGVTHLRIQQLVGGVPVFGGEGILHLWADGVVLGFSDSLVRGISVDTTPTFSAADAVTVALETHRVGYGPAERPEAELVVFPAGGAVHLAWQVRVAELETDEPAVTMVMVDAHTGAVVTTWSDLHTYSLSDSDHTTYDMKNGTSFSSASVGDSSDGDLLTTHDGVEASLAYLAAEFGRDSYDDRGALVKSYGHYSRNYNNAYWDGSRLVFGDGDGRSFGYFGSLDVTAHEFGHAVTEYEADLTYSNESGALNEASSDILGAVVEAYVDGAVSSSTWDMGEDVANSGAIRYMDSPTSDGQSRDHYSNRYTGSSDSGGVHWNSGIANHYFYLLSEGGVHHTASYRSGYTVPSIGITEAYAIWYAALNDYMTRSTNFSGARTATESACTGLGLATGTCDAVSYAWYEVGVGSDPGPMGTGTGTGTTGCPTGFTEITGTLSGTGDNDRLKYNVTASGTHEFELVGPSGTDFDLTLYRKNPPYKVVASDTGSGTSKSVSYSGASGDYLVQVSSGSGSGDYTLCYDIP